MAKKSYEFVDLSFQKERELELEEREEQERKKLFKICLRCGERKSILSFAKDKRYRSGRMGTCKTCRSRESLRYYYQNRDRILIQVKEYQDKKDRSKYFKDYRRGHEAQLKKQAGEWYKKNKKAIKKRNLKYYQENREACLAIRELWREKNKEGIKKYNRQYKRDHKILKAVIL